MKAAKPWYLYLIECVDGSIYTGITVDLDARYAALNIKEGEIVRVKLNDSLSKAHLRCALFNRSDYASAFKVIATIENGIARRA